MWPFFSKKKKDPVSLCVSAADKLQSGDDMKFYGAISAFSAPVALAKEYKMAFY